MTTSFHLSPGASLQGELRVPGDKSLSHRIILLGAVNEGQTYVTGLLESGDSLALIDACRSLGVEIERLSEQEWCIQGVGLYGLSAPDHPLDLGNSGTAMRLLMGILSAQSFDSELIGDASLMSRPMQRVVDPLRQMGARIALTDTGTAPIRIQGGRSLTSLRYVLPVPSAQVKSALLLAGLYADGETILEECAKTRDHTERLLRYWGVSVVQKDRQVRMMPALLQGDISVDVPGDISAAAFWLVAATVVPGSSVTLRDVNLNETRTGVLDVLCAMGAEITVTDRVDKGAEPMGTIHVEARELHGMTIPAAWVVRAIDEWPVLFVAAAYARGETVITGLSELRLKESNRLVAMRDNLSSLGVDVVVSGDAICIRGGCIQGGEVFAFGDHRVAMAMAVAGLVSEQPITVHDVACVSTSYPDFVVHAKALGAKLVASCDLSVTS